MTEKKNKKKEAQRYSREHDEPFLSFVTRIVNTENKAMTVDEICDKMEGASRSVRSTVLWHTSCSDAVRRGWIEKTRCPDAKGRNRVHYHPLTLHPIGDEIPRPLYVKQGAIDEPPVFVHEGVYNMDEGIDDDETVDGSGWPALSVTALLMILRQDEEISPRCGRDMAEIWPRSSRPSN